MLLGEHSIYPWNTQARLQLHDLFRITAAFAVGKESNPAHLGSSGPLRSFLACHVPYSGYYCIARFPGFGIEIPSYLKDSDVGFTFKCKP